MELSHDAPMIGYETAALRLCALVLNKHLDIFEASTILAVIFSLPKEQTLDALIAVLDRIRSTLNLMAAQN